VQANAAAIAQVQVAKSQNKRSRRSRRNGKGAVLRESQVESSQATVKTAELNLGFTKIISPIDGIAALRSLR